MNTIKINSESVSKLTKILFKQHKNRSKRFRRNLSWLMQQWAAVTTKRRWTTVPPHRNESFSPLSNCFFVLNLSLTKYGQLSSNAFTPLNDFQIILSKTSSKMATLFYDLLENCMVSATFFNICMLISCFKLIKYEYLHFSTYQLKQSKVHMIYSGIWERFPENPPYFNIWSYFNSF